MLVTIRIKIPLGIKASPELKRKPLSWLEEKDKDCKTTLYSPTLLGKTETFSIHILFTLQSTFLEDWSFCFQVASLWKRLPSVSEFSWNVQCSSVRTVALYPSPENLPLLEPLIYFSLALWIPLPGLFQSPIHTDWNRALTYYCRFLRRTWDRDDQKFRNNQHDRTWIAPLVPHLSDWLPRTRMPWFLNVSFTSRNRATVFQWVNLTQLSESVLFDNFSMESSLQQCYILFLYPGLMT